MNKNLIKHVIFPLHEKLIGRKTYQSLDDLEKTQWLDTEEVKDLQLKKLKDILMHSQKNCLFYRKRFADAGFDPSSLKSLGDLNRIPPLSKTEIRQNLDDMVWKDCPGGLHRYNTGGSSGDPLIFYFDRRRQAYDAAARALTHRWWGIDIGDKELYLWGSPVEITKQDRVKNLRDRLTNQLLLSAFDFSERIVPDFVEQIYKFRPKCIFGYPSTIALFCEFASKQRFDLKSIGVEVVFSTAEVLYDHQKELISNTFGGVPVADGYGSREGGFISHECPKRSMHVIDQNVVVEYLRGDRPVGPGEDGEIVVTHLDNWAMPFIRYRTGDVAQFGNQTCRCGRHLSTMKKIQGRTTDFIVSPDGRWQHGLSLIYVIRSIPGVAEFKIVQEAVDQIRVLLKIDETLFPEEGKSQIVEGLRKRMGQMVNIHIEKVDEIEKDASGKYRYVVSKIAEKGFA
jgi:phenylacetate-coenzyme A ligase PaaK-like adenylate-forming protein